MEIFFLDLIIEIKELWSIFIQYLKESLVVNNTSISSLESYIWWSIRDRWSFCQKSVKKIRK